MKVALIDAGQVVNVAEMADDWTGTTWDGLDAIPVSADSSVSPGWTHDGTLFVAPPTRFLMAAPSSVPATGTALVTYTDTFPDAPASVTFDVNGATATVNLTDGSAELDVAPTGPGPIVVTATGRDVPAVTITVEA